MKHNYKKVYCLIMLLCLLTVLSLPAFAVREDIDSGAVDIVLVIDCSGSLAHSDPENYCLSAANMLLDNAIMGETRICVIAFGYPGGENPYVPIDRVDSDISDPQVYVLQELTERSSITTKQMTALKNTIKEKLQYGRDEAGRGRTHISYALEAANEKLRNANTPEGRGCIVLLTDGVNNSRDTVKRHVDAMISQAAAAKQKGWSIYTLFMDWNETNRKKSYEEQLYNPHDTIPALTNAAGGKSFFRLFTTFDRNSKSAINQFFEDVLRNYFTLDSFDIIDNRATIQVDDFVAEMNITIQGGGITGIELYKPGTMPGRDAPVSVQEAEGRIILTAEEDSYAHAKIICPEPGDWTVVVLGDYTTQLKGFCCSMPGYQMMLIPSVVSEEPLLHDETPEIRFEVNFSYCGYQYKGRTEFFRDSFSTHELLLEHKGNGASEAVIETQSLQMEPNEYGYTVTVHTDKLGGDDMENYSAKAHVAGQYIFHSGEEISSAKEWKEFDVTTDLYLFSVKNLPVVAGDTKLGNLSTTLGKGFAPISLAGTYHSPDGDPVRLRLVIDEGKDEKIKTEISDAEELVISNVGNDPATYNATLEAKDEASTKWTELCGFTISVINQEPKPRSNATLPTIILWSDKPIWGSWENPHAWELDLNDYWEDPDDLPLIFSLMDIGSTEEEPVFSAEQNAQETGRIKLNASDRFLAAGTGYILYEVKDSVGASPASAVPIIQVQVESGWAVWWAEYWQVVLFCALGGLALIIACIFIVNLTYVKGTWTIKLKITAQGRALELLGGGDLKKGGGSKRVKQFSLGKYLRKSIPYMTPINKVDIEQAMKTKAQTLSHRLDSVIMRGFFSLPFSQKAGCTFSGVPYGIDDTFKVEADGAGKTFQYRKSNGGDVTFTIKNGDKNNPETLVVILTLNPQNLRR